MLLLLLLPCPSYPPTFLPISPILPSCPSRPSYPPAHLVHPTLLPISPILTSCPFTHRIVAFSRTSFVFAALSYSALVVFITMARWRLWCTLSSIRENGCKESENNLFGTAARHIEFAAAAAASTWDAGKEVGA